jgi:hypothetical protein
MVFKVSLKVSKQTTLELINFSQAEKGGVRLAVNGSRLRRVMITHVAHVRAWSRHGRVVVIMAPCTRIPVE